MAEYYAVLSKAIASLDASSSDARRAVYDKARNALIGQLKAIDPPLPTAEISRQRLELEEAIRRVERETSSVPAAPPAPTPAPRAAPRSSPPPPPPPPAAAPSVQAQQSGPSLDSRQSPQDVFRRAIQEAEREAANPSRYERTPVAARADASWGNDRSDRALPVRAAQSYLPSQGYVEQEARADEPRLAPEYDDEWDPDAAVAPGARLGEDRGEGRGREGKVKRGGGRRIPTHDDHDLIEERARPSRLPVIILLILILAMLGALGALGWSQRAKLADVLASFDSGSKTTAPATVVPAATTTDATAKDTDRLLSGGAAAPASAPADSVRVVTPPPPSGTDAATAPATAPSAIAQVQPPAQIAAPTVQGAAPAPAAAPPAPNASTAAAPPATDADSLVAQKATLYEEPLDAAAAANGVVAINAAATWSFQQSATDGPEVVANIDVPDRSLKIKLTIRRNNDQTLPASHVVEVVVDAPASFPGKSIREVPRLVLKPSEDARGQPLIGASAKVADGFFWIALSGVDADVATNLGLLKDRDWIDLPLVYETGQRAIITFEKGPPGDRVFQKALAAWGG